MTFFIDASTLIFSKNYHYQLDRVPEFWDWLVFHAEAGSVKLPREIYDEIIRQDDDLKEWAQMNKDALLIDDIGYHGVLTEVLGSYAVDPSDADIEEIGNDPYLVACALHHGRLGEPATVVTEEKHAPGKLNAARRIPNACEDVGVDWCNVGGLVGRPGLVTQLNFRTSFRG